MTMAWVLSMKTVFLCIAPGGVLSCNMLVLQHKHADVEAVNVVSYQLEIVCNSCLCLQTASHAHGVHLCEDKLHFRQQAMSHLFHRAHFGALGLNVIL